jgi:cellulose synthase/poly-beta-1,6-N-acetylglucosamine synthase-like glycosyltransferase
MFPFPDPKTTEPWKRFVQRTLEMIPGSLLWATLLGMVFASWLAPVGAAMFVIIYDIYWIHLTIYVATFSTIAYRNLRRGMRINWWERCVRVLHVESYRKEIEGRADYIGRVIREEPLTWREKRILRRERKELAVFAEELGELVPMKEQILDYREIVHVVSIPTANEGPEIIEPALAAIAASSFPKSQIIVILATEEREPEADRLPKVKYLKEKFEGVFRDFIVTTHEVAAGEMKCKASNVAYAARKLMGYLDERHIDYKNVVFSNLDCDSVVHPEYFSALTYAYITDPKRLQRAYQPIPMYHNNIWDTNAFVRVMVTGSSFWHMYQSTRKSMVTFSSHSEAFDTLVKVGFWPVNMISEDSVIYWKAVSYFHGDYEVKPIPLPISLDAVLAETYWKTLKNEYKQKRRWAYGIENFPVSMRALWPDKEVRLTKKLAVTIEMLEGHYSWATAPLIIAFLGWLPLFLGGVAFNESVLAHNLPSITRILMNLALLGLVLFVSLSFLMLPPRPKKYGRMRTVLMFSQWFLAPLIALLGAFPAIDSQTRMLLGKYFAEFWVTEKMRK